MVHESGLLRWRAKLEQTDIADARDEENAADRQGPRPEAVPGCPHRPSRCPRSTAGRTDRGSSPSRRSALAHSDLGGVDRLAELMNVARGGRMNTRPGGGSSR